MIGLDKDNSGSVTREELLGGYDDPVVKQTLEGMDIYKDDLDQLFRLMDCDDSGHLGYDEFVQHFYKAQTQDPRAYLLFMRLHVEKMEYRITRNMDLKLTEML